MSRRRRKPQPHQPSPAGAPGPAGAPLRIVAGGLMALVVTFLGLGFSSLGALVVVPAVAGLLLALVLEDWLIAAASAAVGALAGALLAWFAFAPGAYEAALASMPAYANPDVLQRLLYGDVLERVVQGGAFAMVPAPIVVALAGLVAGVAAGVPRRLHLLSSPRVRTAVGWGLTTVAVLTFAVTVWQATPAFRQSLAQPPVNGAYAYDAHIYLRAYYEMEAGDGYYRSLVRAAAGDRRLQEEGAVKDGLFVGWASSATLIREPATFYLWRLLAADGGVGILRLSLIVCAIVLGLWHWAGQRLAGPAAAFIPWALWPFLLVATSWHNIFFPDWWMALAVLISVAFWLRGLFYAALAAALAAALFREVAVFWLAALCVVALVGLVRDRVPETRRRARVSFAVAAGCAVAFAGLYWLHLRAGSAVIMPNLPDPVTTVRRLQISSAAPLVAKFMAPAEYMMFPYARFAIPGLIFLVLSPAAWWVAQRHGITSSDRLTAAVLPGYLVFWIIFTLTLGAASSYWGQGYMPLALAGLAAMLAALAVPKPRSSSGTR